MKRLLTTLTLGLGLVAATGAAPASAQNAPVEGINTTGNCVTTGSPGNWTISCGDINYSPGQAITVSPTVDTSYAPGDSGVAPAPDVEPVAAPIEEPAPETAPSTESGTVATETDQDADNYADAMEVEIGLDPTNADTDGDGVADGDELVLYSTEPTVWDTDGDGFFDGEELFALKTDPLVWDDAGAGSAPMANETVANDTAAPAETTSAAPAEATTAEPAIETAPEASALDSDIDRLADVDELALGTDPANPDSDGDGYYDGDEAALGSDYFDPASIPAA